MVQGRLVSVDMARDEGNQRGTIGLCLTVALLVHAPGHHEAAMRTIYDIIILGAGVSGIGMAHSLLKKKDQTFLILEKNDGVGGTWRNNTYPGLCCDVPSHFYSYSFSMNPNWSKTFPEQYEILGTLGNFSLIKGKAKSRKSFLLSMAVCSALNEFTFSDVFRCPMANQDKNILFIDTEQSDWHVQKAAKRICGLVGQISPNRLHMYKFRSLSPSERLKYTRELISNTPNLGLVIIDGIRDLITSINDEKESCDISSSLLKWSEEFNIHIVRVHNVRLNYQILKVADRIYRK